MWPGRDVGCRAGDGWAEAAVLLASAGRRGAGCRAISPTVPTAAAVDRLRRHRPRPRARAATLLDEVVLRSYCIGAAHMALGWVRREGIAVDGEGEPHDLTIRSFGVLRAADTPPIEVDIVESDAPAGQRLRRRVRRRGRRRLAARRLSRRCGRAPDDSGQPMMPVSR